jgi:hypothetical protein
VFLVWCLKKMSPQFLIDSSFLMIHNRVVLKGSYFMSIIEVLLDGWVLGPDQILEVPSDVREACEGSVKPKFWASAFENVAPCGYVYVFAPGSESFWSCFEVETGMSPGWAFDEEKFGDYAPDVEMILEAQAAESFVDAVAIVGAEAVSLVSVSSDGVFSCSVSERFVRLWKVVLLERFFGAEDEWSRCDPDEVIR